MLVVSLLFIHVFRVAGFSVIAPFSNLSERISKSWNCKVTDTTPYYNTDRDNWIQHSVTRKALTTTATALFSNDQPSDEDLFLTLLEKKANQRNDNTKTQQFDINTGAGAPRPSLGPDEIVPLLMTALQNIDVPNENDGLIAMWDFATDTTKFVFKGNRTEFIESCHETAHEFPTSFYGAAMNGTSWAIETDINRVGGENGWIATQVTSTISSDGRMRRWQWELRKNRRPPCLGCWKVENIGSSDRKGNFEPD